MSCKGCKHWQQIQPGRHTLYTNVGQCKDPRRNEPEWNDDSISTEGDGYFGPVWTGPAFTCAHHEAP